MTGSNAQPSAAAMMMFAKSTIHAAEDARRHTNAWTRSQRVHVCERSRLRLGRVSHAFMQLAMAAG